MAAVSRLGRFVSSSRGNMWMLIGGVSFCAVGYYAAVSGKYPGKAFFEESKAFVEWLCSPSEDEAVAKAYEYLGVMPYASNKKLNTAFRRLCRAHHPDKEGGSHDKFLRLQTCMAIIKAHRER